MTALFFDALNYFILEILHTELAPPIPPEIVAKHKDFAPPEASICVNSFDVVRSDLNSK